jgi:hypothetical protein
MRRQRRRLMHYSGFALHDGTVLAMSPIRKPTPHMIKRDRLSIDEDGVCQEYAGAGRELSDVHNETRMRFLDIIATRLNTRRSLRELVLPALLKLQTDIDEMRRQLADIQRLLANRPPADAQGNTNASSYEF